MIFSIPDLIKKRQKFREDLKKGKILRFVGSFSPLISCLIEKQGFEGIYVSGAVISSDLAMPDVELITLSELAGRGSSLVQNQALPGLVDADTGFGGSLNVARTVQKLEQAGFCGLHIEDQKSPKRCGHLNNKKLIDIKEMQKKIEVALKARTDSSFLIAVRTDARGVEGVKAAIKRAKAYVEAGAEAIFPEALETKEEFQKLRQALKVPLIANMTEFGKSELISTTVLQQMGYNIVLYPVTSWRLALKAVAKGLETLHTEGHQKELLNKMLTRKELYHLLEYDEYAKWDKEIY
ncbi:MAG: methylisocitrate lyase [Bdellovibrionales bacterium]|nr:methylisocitrate lyase [Bdellovibrionales bacterium]